MTDDTTMRAAQVPEPGGKFEVVEREVPDLGPDEVRVAVDACGVCFSDSYVRRGRTRRSSTRARRDTR